MRSALCCLCLFLAFVPPHSPEKEKTVPDSEKGFRKQFGRVVGAYEKGDQQAIRAALDSFAIPEHWFTDVFGPEEGPKFAKVYSDRFKSFELLTQRKLDMAMQAGKANFQARSSDLTVQAELSPTGVLKPPPKPPPALLQPLPPIQRYGIATIFVVRGELHRAASWMDSFIYLEGFFRFLGGGAYPFWDPTFTLHSDSCAKPGEKTDGKLIRRVEPVYPDEAKQKHVHGVVFAWITVTEDGSVKEVDIQSGDPLLFEAAKQAIMQWRFTPFMNCGTPVEARWTAHVEFVLR